MLSAMMIKSSPPIWPSLTAPGAFGGREEIERLEEGGRGPRQHLVTEDLAKIEIDQGLKIGGDPAGVDNLGQKIPLTGGAVQNFEVGGNQHLSIPLQGTGEFLYSCHHPIPWRLR
jgi:hypothetical protein